MNINNIPEPPIKPTKMPSIMKDQDKEARFAAGQSLVDLHVNPNAQPSKGGFLENTRKYLEEQNRLAQQRTQQARAGSSFKLSTPKKKGNPGWVIIFVVFWIGISAIGAIVPEEDDVYDTPLYDTTESSIEVTTVPSSSLGVYTIDNSCMSFELPSNVDLGNNPLGFNDCEIGLSIGYSYSYTVSSDSFGSSIYQTADELFETIGLEVIQSREVNGIALYTTSNSYGFENSTFWIRDLGITDESGRIVVAVQFAFYDPSAPENDALLNAVRFVDNN